MQGITNESREARKVVVIIIEKHIIYFNAFFIFYKKLKKN
jgi:hypothetical protein